MALEHATSLSSGFWTCRPSVPAASRAIMCGPVGQSLTTRLMLIDPHREQLSRGACGTDVSRDHGRGETGEARASVGVIHHVEEGGHIEGLRQGGDWLVVTHLVETTGDSSRVDGVHSAGRDRCDTRCRQSPDTWLPSELLLIRLISPDPPGVSAAVRASRPTGESAGRRQRAASTAQAVTSGKDRVVTTPALSGDDSAQRAQVRRV